MPASTASSVNVNRSCRKGSIPNLQLQRKDDGKFSIEFGVDIPDHACVAWKINVTGERCRITAVV
jgi:hypothetical protein